MKQRIWELDALRGLFLLIMAGFHLWYDLVYLFGIVELTAAGLYRFLNNWGGVLFLVLSGLCVTLGSHPVRRGLTVLAGGFLISLVSAGMYLLNFADKSILIYFGVLHCLGVCMLLWPLIKHLPVWAQGVLGAVMILLGLYLRSQVRVSVPYWIPFGIMFPGFASSDYFPLLPNLGYFLVGAVLGQTLYRRKESRLPGWLGQNPLSRLLCFLGRNSLLFYLLHQPVLVGLVALFTMFF